ncbi:MAG TPA: succinate dehydrogenase assembly factor 2 [Rhodobiaceae bacterium]|jgi:antitoxin CptB|nr:succinate dehydrogenase assembly factor 2 [Rhodobiaceae bacterium]
MSETKQTRLRKLDYRSRHRGIREMDIVFGRFAEQVLETLTDAELDDYERILELPDDKLFSWATGREQVPDDVRSPLLDALLSLAHMNPTD